MNLFLSDWIFNGKNLLKDQYLLIGDAGEVLYSGPQNPLDGTVPEKTEGIISPSFVNAHCHLELSYLRGMIPEKTGMAEFIIQVQRHRGAFSDEERLNSIVKALDELKANGVTGLGDICNGDSTFDLKKSNTWLDNHVFCELFGNAPGKADEIFYAGLELSGKASPLSATVTLHAPYSVSKNLRDKVWDYASKRDNVLSVHLLESKQERQLFGELDGPLMDFLRMIGAQFQGNEYDSPVDYVLGGMSASQKILLVHMTEATKNEIEKLGKEYPAAFFVLCPNANLYIHDSLPDPVNFKQFNDRICIGTDSLASNHSLSILSEMKTLQERFQTETALLLQWATLNGANALGFDPEKYSIQKGGRPDLVRITETDENANFTENSKIEWLILQD